MDLFKKSVEELNDISKMCLQIARDLKKEIPSYFLAVENGVIDNGYDTTANGWVSSYGGTAIVKLDNGKEFRCIGHRAGGNAYYASDGYIEFIPLN